MPLDEHRRLHLAELPPKGFETFWQDFFLSDVVLRVQHDGAWIEAKVMAADSYGSASGMKDDGIDLRLSMDSGAEWAAQCKRVRKFGLPEARAAVEKARGYQARHYLLLVACDTTAPAQRFIDDQPNWTMWNLDRICAEVRRQIAPERLPKLLHFLTAEEVRNFAPWTSHALVSPVEFFARTLGPEKLFRHDWRLVGRAEDLAALRTFAASADRQVFVLLSKGGDGKSRLLWEFSRDFVAQHPGAEVRFFNPNSDHPIDLALLSSARPLVIVVDDAHREVLADAGRNPRFGQLLDAVRELPHTRLVLATRPHALTALLNRISEAGLSEVRETPKHLSRLSGADVRALADEALSPEYRSHTEGLLGLTRDSPFMTVMAGEFIRLGRIAWGTWANESEFRREVFRRFEDENLKLLPESDRVLARRILRLAAMLAPVPSTPEFYSSAKAALGSGDLEIERVWTYLEQAELLVGRRDGMRVAPDLFGDFLVFAVCFEPSMKEPAFVRGVTEALGQKSPALLQNLAEAAWLADASGLPDDGQMASLIETEMTAFRRESFYQRAERLTRWQSFGVYLPKPALALGTLALDLDTAPPDAALASWSATTGSELDTQNHLLGKVAPLVAPIANYHKEQRHEALELLWRLGGKREKTLTRMFNSEEPDEAIARVIKYERGKPISVTLDALEWLRRKLEIPTNLQRLEEQPSLLSAWLRPCFERFVEIGGREGARMWFGQREVLLDNTRPIRRAALEIIRGVLAGKSWRLALAGVSAIARAIHRVAKVEVDRAEDGEKMRERWRPERMEGLSALSFALEHHDHFLVRYAVRALLRSDLAFEKDKEFAIAAARVAEAVAVDLDLQTAVALLAGGSIADFLEEERTDSGSERMQRARAKRDSVVGATAAKLLATYPQDEALLAYLSRISRDLDAGHYTPTFVLLFAAFAQHAPERAVAIARRILHSPPAGRMADDFLALLDRNPSFTPDEQTELFRIATQSRENPARAAVVRWLTWQADQRQLSNDERALLDRCARDPSPHELHALLDFVRWARGPALEWAVEIIPLLPLEAMAAEHANKVFEALTPEGASAETFPSTTLVAEILARLVAAPEIELDSFHEITQLYPRQALDFILARLRYAESKTAPPRYFATPRDWRLRLDFPQIVHELDYRQLCDELWQRALDQDHRHSSDWLRLFQSVVLHEGSGWQSRLLAEINRAESLPHLLRVAELLHFGGSLIVFRHPEIARAFLDCARAIGSTAGEERMRARLYIVSGPESRGYTGGELNREDDYLEAEALKCAERHRDDDVLGPFYRWVVECEQKDRQWHRNEAAASMAELEES
jgi:hypothetical protein